MRFFESEFDGQKQPAFSFTKKEVAAFASALAKGPNVTDFKSVHLDLENGRAWATDGAQLVCVTAQDIEPDVKVQKNITLVDLKAYSTQAGTKEEVVYYPLIRKIAVVSSDFLNTGKTPDPSLFSTVPMRAGFSFTSKNLERVLKSAPIEYEKTPAIGSWCLDPSFFHTLSYVAKATNTDEAFCFFAPRETLGAMRWRLQPALGAAFWDVVFMPRQPSMTITNE